MKIVPRTNKKESIFLSLRSVRFGFYDAIRDPRKGLAKSRIDLLVVEISGVQIIRKYQQSGDTNLLLFQNTPKT